LPNQLKILIVQTAFIGDVVLALPLAQVLRKKLPDAQIDFVVIPRTAGLLLNHPAINNTIIFDKRGVDKGIFSLINLSRKLKSENYDIAIVPHRSLRSAMLVRMAGCKIRIGFSKSAGKILFTDIVTYPPSMPEVERNLTLLRKMAIIHNEKELPHLYPTDSDKEVVEKLLSDEKILNIKKLICVAPGSVWYTKRWRTESYIELVEKLVGRGFSVGLIGGEDDYQLCNLIHKSVDMVGVFNTAGKLTLLQSAEILRRCSVLVSNDSAPVHLAAAFNIPAVAIFGATVPAFGFAPYSDCSVVVETYGLKCRPCAIHGGDVCPIKTFDCMKMITAETVFEKVVDVYYNK
jgi:heptosyltransferase-2